MPPLPENPLPPCRYATNCLRESRHFTRSPKTLYADAIAAVRELGGPTIGWAREIRREADGRGLHVICRVFVFTDDLHLRVEPQDDGAVLHVRSASRVGRGDLGINRRRVRALFDALG